MASKGHDIIVIGTSAGGLEALDALIGQLPSDLAASIFIVQHMASENTGGALLHRLSRHRTFGCKLAKDGEALSQGESISLDLTITYWSRRIEFWLQRERVKTATGQA
jgi:two-component system chemotaxis response regulator CheB